MGRIHLFKRIRWGNSGVKKVQILLTFLPWRGMCLCPEYSILCVSYVLLYFEYNVRMYRTTVHVRLVSKEPKNQEVSRETYFSFSLSPNPQPSSPPLLPTDRPLTPPHPH